MGGSAPDIVAFLVEIGIPVRAGAVTGPTAVPGSCLAAIADSSTRGQRDAIASSIAVRTAGSAGGGGEGASS